MTIKEEIIDKIITESIKKIQGDETTWINGNFDIAFKYGNFNIIISRKNGNKGVEYISINLDGDPVYKVKNRWLLSYFRNPKAYKLIRMGESIFRKRRKLMKERDMENEKAKIIENNRKYIDSLPETEKVQFERNMKFKRILK